MARGTMTRKQLKEQAQEQLLFGVQAAFDFLDNGYEDNEELKKEMSMQMARIEKLFGYYPGSFSRGV